MSASDKKIGQIGWHDLTVENADEVREFYEKVVGWKTSPVSMGDYNDHNALSPTDDTPVAGICHKRRVNADLPSKPFYHPGHIGLLQPRTYITTIPVSSVHGCMNSESTSSRMEISAPVAVATNTSNGLQSAILTIHPNASAIVISPRCPRR